MTAHTLKRKQRGMALIVSLVLLLALTIIGLTAARSASVEERMTANDRDRQLAFQSAESALLATEGGLLQNLWTNFLPPGSSGMTPGLYQLDPSNPPVIPLWQSMDWTDSSNYIGYSSIAGQSLTGVAQQPEVIIEQLPPTATPGQGLSSQQYASGQPGVKVYRVTALGLGGDTDAQAMLQTTFHQ